MGKNTALLALGGGLLAGVGKGVIDYAIEEARTQKQITLQKMEQEWRTGESDKDRAFRSTEAEKQRQHSTGLLSNTERFLDDEGKMWLRLPSGGTKPVLDPSGKQIRGAMKPDKEPLVEVYDEDSPTGATYVPSSAAKGRPSGRNAEKKIETVAGAKDQERRDAREQAEKEASDKAGWFSSDETDFESAGGSRNAWIEKRANEIIAERKGGSRAADETQQAGTGSQTAGTDTSSGAGQDIKIGTIAKNPKTGERMRWNGTKWELVRR